MKKIRLLSLLLLASCLTLLPLQAEDWHPSQSNQVISIPEGYETVEVNGTPLIITTDNSYQYKEEPAVIVSPAVSPIDSYTTEVYNNALSYAGKSTDTYLYSYNGLHSQIENRLHELMGNSASTNNLRIHSVFDVWANDVARRIINEQGYVNVTVALHGITKNNRYIAVHFPNNSKDPEVIPCTWDEGMVTLTLGTEFSPVMILSYETRKADPDTSIKGEREFSSYFLPVLLIPCVFLFLRKKVFR